MQGAVQMNTNNMLTEIAVYRCKMNRFSKGKILTDPDVVKSSQGLDILIYKYLKARHQQDAISVFDSNNDLPTSNSI